MTQYSDNSFIHIEHLYSPLSENNLREKVLGKRQSSRGRPLQVKGPPSRRHRVLLNGGTGKGDKKKTVQMVLGIAIVIVVIVIVNRTSYIAPLVESHFTRTFRDRSHSFIHAISIAPLQVHYYSEALPTQHGYCVEVSR